MSGSNGATGMRDDQREDHQREPGRAPCNRLKDCGDDRDSASASDAAHEPAPGFCAAQERCTMANARMTSADRRVGQPGEQVLDGASGRLGSNPCAVPNGSRCQYAATWRLSDRARWTAPRRGGRTPLFNVFQCAGSDEKFPAQAVHLVEFADLRDPILDLDVRRKGRRGRVRQPLLSDPRRQNRSGARFRAALGDLQRLYAEASTIPPSWHGWMHHTVDMPPTQENYKPQAWQKPHRPNMTGTPGAYRPPGSTLAARPPSEGDRRLQGLDAR